MTDITPATTTATASKLPTYVAYHLRERETQKPIWTRIGAAWVHADGRGMTIQTEMTPLDGRIVLRVPAEPQI